MDESTHETPAEQTPPVETISQAPVNEVPVQAPVEAPAQPIAQPSPFANSDQPQQDQAFPVVKRRKGWKFWVPVVVGIAVIVAAAIVVIPMLLPHTSPTPVAQTTNSSSTPAVSPATPLSSGTDNQSLQSDLTNIQSTQDQETTDQNSTTSSLNDSSQQIAVPTE